MSRNRLSTTCQCEMPLDDDYRVEAELLTEAQYGALSPAKRYYGDNGGHGWAPYGVEVRFRRVVCPLCGAAYAVWYRRNPYTDDKWSAFESSYFVAFNDEPAMEDEPTRQVTVLDVVREFIMRQGAATR